MLQFVHEDIAEALGYQTVADDDATIGCFGVPVCVVQAGTLLSRRQEDFKGYAADVDAS
jgi:hypothetical protein